MNRQRPMQIRNVGLPAAPRTTALQEQAGNLSRVGSLFSASCFHLCGQHQDWWLSLATGCGSVPTTLRRLPPKHCHHSQVVVRQNSLPSKLCACCRWHSRAPCLAARHEVENTSSLQDVSKHALDQHVSPLQKRYVCQTYNLLRPRQYLNQNGKKRTSRTYNRCPSAPSDTPCLFEPADAPA